MALPEISFDPIDDVHMLLDQDVELMDRLRVGSDTATEYQTAHPAIQFTFTPFFKNIDGTAANPSGFHITVDTQTGVVSTQSTLTEWEKPNFLIKVVATLNGEKQETLVRIHVHHSMSDAWLTPAILTYQKGTSGVRFAVRVHFDDDVVATITPRDTHFDVSWDHPKSGVVDPSDGLIAPVGLTDMGLLTDPVEATIDAIGAANPAITATGHVYITDTLVASSNETHAELISTGNCPGFVRAHEIPNILFLPDGFTIDDRPAFDACIDQYVADLVHGKITAPFDLLSGSVNYWKVFLSSGDRGITTRSEISVVERDGSPRGIPFPAPEEPRRKDGSVNSDAATWHHADLYYAIGLPVAADRTLTPKDLREQWKHTTLLADSQIDAITDDAVNAWKHRGLRRLPEQMDSILGLTVFDTTAAVTGDDFRSIRFDSAHRLTRVDLDQFLVNLTDTDGNAIGPYFLKGAENLRGKDYRNIVFITSSPRGRAQNFNDGIFVPLREWTGSYPLAPGALTDLKVNILFNNTIPQLSLDNRATITHELGHSFALEDEYGETPSDDAYKNRFINDPLVVPWGNTLYAESPSALDWSGNVQARKDLLSPDPQHPGTAIADPQKLKWRYHRIDKCGLVAGVVTVGAQQYHVPLRPGRAASFSQGDKVFLRKRIGFRYSVSRAASGTHPAVLPQMALRIVPDTAHLSDAWITSINVPANQIVVEDMDHHAFTVTFVDAASAAMFQMLDSIRVSREIVREPIASLTRLPPPPPVAAISSDTITRLISQELEVVSKAGDTVIVKVTDNSTLPAPFLLLESGEIMILYKPMDAPDSAKAAGMKYAEVLSKKVLDYLVANPFPFNAKKDANHGNAVTEIIDDSARQPTSIPSSLVPCCSRQEKKIVGFYSGGDQYHGGVYHPTGQCFMRVEYHKGIMEEFCVVCKYCLVDMIDPEKHGALNGKYSKKIYPK